MKAFFKRIFKAVEKFILNRRTQVIFLLLLQLAIMGLLIWLLSGYSVIFSLMLSLISLFVVVYIVNTRVKPGYKLSWMALILTFPIFGGLFYLILKLQSSSGAMKRNREYYDLLGAKYLCQDATVKEEFLSGFPEYHKPINYMTGTAGYPLYGNTATRFLTPGEEFFPIFTAELEKAKKFIFLEFFILADGYMWETTLDILKRKAAEGVDVRLMYDDIGSMFNLPDGFDKTLTPYGIKCKAFNRFRPLWSSVQNNRDHRKIMIIDGEVAFTGGVNLSDEYINRKTRFGYWKDCAVMLRGDAVWSFTVAYLQMWDRIHGITEDFLPYKQEFPKLEGTDGYVLPYADAPDDVENVSEHAYMQMITQAKRYLYIETPYLIIDDTMMSALILAAKSGVDIRIITPAIPDKKLVFMTTRSYYLPLLKAGVRIYEYTPGFIHSKVVVSDDECAAVGTPNFDFRALYLHFECGTLMYGTDAVKQAKQDFLDMLDVCHKVTVEEMERNFPVRVFQSFLRLFAPFL
ncbi:MAG: cardiolipin synthase [Clostridia bacterium]|nr:cardiolipin synthase [Clostridia bacterium]